MVPVTGTLRTLYRGVISYYLVVCKDYFKGKNEECDENNILKWDPFYYVKGLCLFSKAVFRIRIRIRSGFIISVDPDSKFGSRSSWAK
jgi:hypothetical protein